MPSVDSLGFASHWGCSREHTFDRSAPRLLRRRRPSAGCRRPRRAAAQRRGRSDHDRAVAGQSGTAEPADQRSPVADPHRRRGGRAASSARSRRATGDDDATPADQPSPTVTVPPTSLRDRCRRSRRSRPGRTTSTRSTEHRRRGSSSPSAPGGGLGLTATSCGSYVTPSALDSWRHRRMRFSRPDAVFSDACHPSDGYHPGPWTTLDGLVAALSEQQGMGRRDRPVGHLHRRLRRQSIPTHRPRRHVGLRQPSPDYAQRLARRWCSGYRTPCSEAGSQPRTRRRGLLRTGPDRDRCGSSTSTARSSSSTRNCCRSHRRRLTLISPTPCSTRSASSRA